MKSKRIILLGCTGSIGRSAQAVIDAHPERFRPVALSAHTRRQELRRTAEKWGIEACCLTGTNTDEGFPFRGPEGLLEMVRKTKADMVLNGISGAAGLAVSLLTLEMGRDLALANKESIVMAGPLLEAKATEHGGRILPVDSEHAAVFELLRHRDPRDVAEIILTASGGAFRDWNREELKTVTPREALKHPTWDMGAKITIDSATMANKGLEVIEACRLFGMPPERVTAVIHPQSIVHSLIRLNDGVLYAQLSRPDMQTPILSALSYPECVNSDISYLDLTKGVSLDFRKAESRRYPMLALAYQALKRGTGGPVVYNAANEEAVAAFLEERIPFTAIHQVVEETLADIPAQAVYSMEEILELDSQSRRRARRSKP